MSEQIKTPKKFLYTSANQLTAEVSVSDPAAAYDIAVTLARDWGEEVTFWNSKRPEKKEVVSPSDNRQRRAIA